MNQPKGIKVFVEVFFSKPKKGKKKETEWVGWMKSISLEKY